MAKSEGVYGTAVEREGLTVVPVARVLWGYGLRGAIRHGEREEDARGGGGVVATPLGYMEISQGRAEFRRIKTTAESSRLFAATLAGAAVGWTLGRFVR